MDIVVVKQWVKTVKPALKIAHHQQPVVLARIVSREFATELVIQVRTGPIARIAKVTVVVVMRNNFV